MLSSRQQTGRRRRQEEPHTFTLDTLIESLSEGDLAERNACIWEAFLKWMSFQFESERYVGFGRLGVYGYKIDSKSGHKVPFLYYSDQFCKEHHFVYRGEVYPAKPVVKINHAAIAKHLNEISKETVAEFMDAAIQKIYRLMEEGDRDIHLNTLGLLRCYDCELTFEAMVPSRQQQLQQFDSVRQGMLEKANKTFVRQLIDKEGRKMNLVDLDKKAILTSRQGFLPQIDQKYRRQKETQSRLRPQRTSRKKETQSSSNLKGLEERSASASQFEKIQPNESPTRRFKKFDSNIVPELLGAGTDPLKRNQDFAKLASDAKNLMRATFFLPDTLEKRLPPIIDKFARTLACPIAAQRQNPMTCGRIGSNLAPTTKCLEISDKGVIALKLPVSNFENQLHLAQILTDEEEYLEIMGGEPSAERLAQKKDSFERYTRILSLIPSDCIAKYRQEWLDHIFLLLEKRYEDPELIEVMVEDIYELYEQAVKKAMIDYILLEQSEMVRIGVFRVFKPVPFYGQQRLVYKGFLASKEVQRKNHVARAVLQETLSLTSTYILEIQRMWKEYEDNLLVELPRPGQDYTTIDEFEAQQKLLLKHRKEDLMGNWMTRLAELYRQQVSDLNRDQEKSELFFEAAATLLYRQIRQLVKRSIQKYLDFLEVYWQAVPNPPETVLHLEEETGKYEKCFLIIRLTSSRNEILFCDQLENVKDRLLAVIDQLVEFSERIPRPENIISKTDNLYVRAIGKDDYLYVDSRARAQKILMTNLDNAGEVMRVYNKYLFLLTEGHVVEKWVAAGNHDRREYAVTIDKYRRLYDEVLQRMPYFLRLNMVYIDSTELKRRCLKLIQQLIERLEKSVYELVMQRNTHILRELTRIVEVASEKAYTSEKVVELQNFLEKVRRTDFKQLSELHADMIRWVSISLYSSGYGVTEDDLKQMYVTADYLHKFLARLDVEESRLFTERFTIEEKIKEHSKDFGKKVQELLKELEKLREFGSRMLKDSALTLTESCRQRIDKYKLEMQHEINEKEDMLGMNVSEFPKLLEADLHLKPFEELWVLVRDFSSCYAGWTKDSIFKQDSEAIELQVKQMLQAAMRLSSAFPKVPNSTKVATECFNDLSEFQKNIPVIAVFSNPGLKERHLNEISQLLEVAEPIRTDQNISLNRLLNMSVQHHLQRLEVISETATKEHMIEQTLVKMNAEWEPVVLETKTFKETGTHIIMGASLEEIQALLDDHSMKTITMKGSVYAKTFQAELDRFEEWLSYCMELLEFAVKVQTGWMYLEPVMTSPDILKHLSVEGMKFRIVDEIWRLTMMYVTSRNRMVLITDDRSYLTKLKECNANLEIVQRGLNAYLESKRLSFPRFFFLSSEQLLEILSQTKDPTKVQPHLKKCFEGIQRLNFEDMKNILGMYSSEGEYVKFTTKINTTLARGNVDQWLVQVEAAMIENVRREVQQSHFEFSKMARKDWVLSRCGMAVLNVDMTNWTSDVESSLKKNRGLAAVVERMGRELGHIIQLIRSPTLKELDRLTLEALIVLSVHNQDITQMLHANGTTSINAFGWQSQMRYYFVSMDTEVRILNAVCEYNNEYLGNSSRLVITPLTDRCYRTLCSAVYLNYGGAPEGPAGTGKTETVKDLAKALARQCVVFNCSDGLDYKAMGKFFKGLASSGAWSCFDEFNRIDLEVLSVVAQQILTIQIARTKGLERFLFEETEISMKKTANCFITMNPGYAGRSELPDNLKALFRSVAMMVPDYAMIAEISLYSYGFTDARNLARKIVTTYKLCSEQLSSQEHYDYGMRAVKSVLVAAGNLKRRYLTEHESVLMLKAINDVNLAKFLAFDIPLFEGITSDLFPGVKAPEVDYAALLSSLQKVLKQHNLQTSPYLIEKVVQIYDMILVRHGLMVVGLPFSGKTTAISMLAKALTMCAKEQTMQEYAVETSIINPKSITLRQLYGSYDEVSNEWSDGVLAVRFRHFARSEEQTRKWLILDGPVDAVWIENMNTVLDDNKKLCLNSGEIIAMNRFMNLIFEPMDLLAASPATVSRCGMIYMEPASLGTMVLFESWLERMRAHIPEAIVEEIVKLFELSYAGCYREVQNLKPISYVSQASLIVTFLRMLEAQLQPFISTPELYDRIDVKNKFQVVGCLYLFSLMWTFGGCLDSGSRKPFDTYVKKIFSADLSTEKGKKKKLVLPEKGSLFDYGFSINFEKSTGEWYRWVDTLQEETFNLKKTPLHQIIVKTADTVRYEYLLEQSIAQELPVLLCGPTGTGKTTYVKNLLLNKLPKDKYNFIEMMFSAQTTSSQTQEQLESKLERRGKGLVGPKLGKLILFVDDLNMPVKEKYGAQPPVELLRQCIDQHGFYDHREKERSFKRLVDLLFVFSMGEPGGGRTFLSPRLLRHCNLVSVTVFDDETLNRIFMTLLTASFRNHSEERHLPNLLSHCLTLYNECVKNLLPTPTKSHYLFNLRDLSKLVLGICRADKEKVHSENIGRLFAYEAKRVFMDRLLGSDRQLVDRWIRDIGKRWGKNIKDVYWTDILSSATNSLTHSYEQVADIQKVNIAATAALANYNMISNKPMDLVLFKFALEHLLIILRIIKQPKGNALLVGVGGSGRQSMTRLACYICDFEPCEIEITRNYGLPHFREDLRKVMTLAGVKNRQTVFIFNDGQIKEESFVQDLNNLLNSGEVPNLFPHEQRVELVELVRKDAQQADPELVSPQQLYTFFVERVKLNLRVVLCFSPIGEMFRTRVRMFPSLVNCTTINWYEDWPADGLISVARKFLGEVELDNKEAYQQLCQWLHESTKAWSVEYKLQLKRHYYVTPTSYIELISSFKSILAEKRKLNKQLIYKYENGYIKIIETERAVEEMKLNLEEMKPVLRRAAEDTLMKMEQVADQKKEADVIMEQIASEEAIVMQAVNEANAIKQDCEKDLAVALPQLRAAENALLVLDKNKLTELKTMMNPPLAVKLVMQGVCLLVDPQPKEKVKNEKTLKMETDWWAASVRLLGNPKLLNNLVDFDKESVAEQIIVNLGKFLNDPNYRQSLAEENVANSSQACECLIKWINGIYNFYWVNKKVKPKKESLKEAEGKVAILNKKLAVKQQELAAANKKVENLNAQLKRAEHNRDRLEKEYRICELSLERASTIIDNLGGEKTRWLDLANFNKEYAKKLDAEVLLASSIVAYLGVFTQSFRNRIVEQWRQEISKQLTMSSEFSLRRILGDPIKIREWNLNGLPLDEYSTQNALILFASRRWPLMIDPQGQANRWLKKLEADRKLSVIKLTDDGYLRTLENCIQFGTPVLLQNIGQEIDAAITPVLMKQTYKKGATTYLKLGEQVLVYSTDFCLYITTKLRNPHYLPQTSTKVTLINFMITEEGLTDQLLAIVVSKERPDLETEKEKLIVEGAQNKKTLQAIEDKILDVLSNSQNILAEETAIKVLSASKQKSNEVSQKQIEAQQTEAMIDVARKEYTPIAAEASMLFFAVSDLGNIDPMYQYSLSYFIELFSHAIRSSEKADELQQRLSNLKHFFRLMLFNNISRSLFEKHRLLFSVIIALKMLKVDEELLRFLLTGGTDVGGKLLDKPQLPWLTPKMWAELNRLSGYPGYDNICFMFNEPAAVKLFEIIVQSAKPLEQRLPGAIFTMDTFSKLLVYRCIRPDKLIPAFQGFVEETLGPEFIRSLPFDLSKIYPDSNAITPLIFLLSPGSDPFVSLNSFSQEKRKEMFSISLGQGQGPLAQKLISENSQKGGWVVLQNCHLATTWMGTLEKIVQNLSTQAGKINKQFRLWLTSYPTTIFPQSVLQQSLKITNEPPKGLKNNLLLSFLTDPVKDPEFFESSLYTKPFKRLLYSLCFFHAVVQERRKYGPLGWNISYEFTDSDLRISCRQLKIYLDGMVKGEIPFEALIYLTAECNYGGRVTDDKDRRLITTLLKDYYNPTVVDEENHNYGQTEEYVLHGDINAYEEFLQYIESLPDEGSPELVGLHPNADITKDMNESSALLESLLACSSESSSSKGASLEDTLNSLVDAILTDFPKQFDLQAVIAKYPVIYEQSMNTVLNQQLTRFNRLLKTIEDSLHDLKKALKGLLVMSSQLERTAKSLYDGKVPELWMEKSYPSLKPLSNYITDLKQRCAFFGKWVAEGIPQAFWLSGFFFTQSFLTGVLQNFSRKVKVPVDEVVFDFNIIKEVKPHEHGAIIYGLFIEGARWDEFKEVLQEPFPKQLFSPCPLIYLKPVQLSQIHEYKHYEAPMYKTLTRRGVLSTTGHSTNFVMYVKMPTQKPSEHWVKRGVALITQLND